jgi:ATP-dependent Clp protease adaptor protein ClpS
MADEKLNIEDLEGELLTEEATKLKRPDMYRIVLLNDDYTPREFVVWVLIKVFHKNEEEGTRIMLEAHTRGKSIIGVYTYDIARTKVMQVDDLAKQHEHPLKCDMEVEEGGEEG